MRYAHLRAAVAGTPTVSGVVPSAARGMPVVGFAVPFQTPSGRRVFSGGYPVEDTPVAPFVRNVLPFKTANVAIVDSGGVILASNRSAAVGRPMNKANPLLAQISTPTSYLGSGAQRQYISQGPIPGTSWRLVFAVGTDELFAPLSGGGRWLPWLALIAFGASALVALAIFYPFLIQRAQLVDSEAHRRAILDTASDAFIGMSSAGLITEWNHRAVELFGWPRDEAIGYDLADLIIAPGQREAHRAGLRRVLAADSRTSWTSASRLTRYTAMGETSQSRSPCGVSRPVRSTSSAPSFGTSASSNRSPGTLRRPEIKRWRHHG